MTTNHGRADKPEVRRFPQAPRSARPVRGWRRLARMAVRLCLGFFIGLVIGASFAAGLGPKQAGPPPPEAVPVRRVPVRETRPKVDLSGTDTDNEMTNWGTAKRLVAFLLKRSPHEINAREARTWLRRGEARRAYRDDHDQITWGEAKEVIANLLDVTKALIDAEERRLEIEELAALTALVIKRQR